MVEENASLRSGSGPPLVVRGYVGGERATAAREQSFATHELHNEWDAFVASNDHGYHEQTSGYGAIRAASGFEVDRVMIQREGRILGGAQILVQPTPLGRFARVFRAPLARDDDPQLLSEVAQSMEERARQRSYVSLRVDLFPTQIAAIDVLASHGFRPSRAWYGELLSASVDLSRSDAEIQQRMSRDAQRCIRVARRHEVEIRWDDETSVEAFYALRCSSAQHHGYLIYALEYYQYIWQLFSNSGKAGLHTAYYEDTAVGSLFTCRVGARMYFMWMGTHRGEREKKAMANYLMYAAAIKRAREQGCTHCDCMGRRFFTAKLMPETIEWPLPTRKFYGPLRAARRGMMESAWAVPRLRHGVNTLAKRLGLRPKMAY